MRKTCAKPVEWVGMGCENGDYLCAGSIGQQVAHVRNLSIVPNFTHKLSLTLPTAFLYKINLLSTDLSTLYTGLITNTTKYI
jgi:hypothetical protein